MNVLKYVNPRLTKGAIALIQKGLTLGVWEEIFHHGTESSWGCISLTITYIILKYSYFFFANRI